MEEKRSAEDAGSTLFPGEQEARESLVTRVGVGSTSLQTSPEEGLGHRAWHTAGTWEVVNKWPENGWLGMDVRLFWDGPERSGRAAQNQGNLIGFLKEGWD